MRGSLWLEHFDTEGAGTPRESPRRGPDRPFGVGVHMGTRGARAAKADGGKPAQSATTTPGGKHVRGATPPRAGAPQEALPRPREPGREPLVLRRGRDHHGGAHVRVAQRHRLRRLLRDGRRAHAAPGGHPVAGLSPHADRAFGHRGRERRRPCDDAGRRRTGAYALSESVWQLALPVALALYYLAAPWPRCVFTELLDLAPVARPDIPSWRQLFFRHSTWPGCRWLSRGRLRALTGESAHRRAGPRAVLCCHRTGLRRPASPRT